MQASSPGHRKKKEDALVVNRALVFGACVFVLAEASLIIENGGVLPGDVAARELFNIHFMVDGVEFEDVIDSHVWTLTRLARDGLLSPAFTDREMIRRVESEPTC